MGSRNVASLNAFRYIKWRLSLVSNFIYTLPSVCAFLALLSRGFNRENYVPQTLAQRKCRWSGRVESPTFIATSRLDDRASRRWRAHQSEWSESASPIRVDYLP